MKPVLFACSADCKRVELDPGAAGWSQLEITGRWRCGTCTRELQAASSLVGLNPEPFVDTLPPGSRGALSRETASSISPAVVRP